MGRDMRAVVLEAVEESDRDDHEPSIEVQS